MTSPVAVWPAMAPPSPMAFDVLAVLVRNVGRLVPKRDLLASVWPDTCVEPGILTVYISQLRSALGDTNSPRQYIETVVRFGYRFVAPVVRHQSGRIACSIQSKAVEMEVAPQAGWSSPLVNRSFPENG